MIAPGFGGINLEDIAAPRCFEIEARLRESLDIPVFHDDQHGRSEEHTSELQSLMRISYAVFCLKKKNTRDQDTRPPPMHTDSYRNTSTLTTTHQPYTNCKD